MQDEFDVIMDEIRDTVIIKLQGRKNRVLGIVKSLVRFCKAD
jgi:hypothetical protein